MKAFLFSFLVILAAPQDPPTRKSSGDSALDLRVNQALDMGVPRLVSWLPHEEGDRLALLLWAAMEGGASPEEPAVAAAMERLLRFRTGFTYGAGLLLLLFQKHGGPKAAEAIRRTARDLLSWQGSDGGWGYGASRTRSDASNTQYAVLGLRAAWQAGIVISDRALERAARYCLASRGPEGGFSYTVDGRRNQATASMTAGNLGSLAICRELAGKEGLGAPLDRKVESDTRLSLWWLEKRLPTFLGRGHQVTMHSGYLLYALERAMILLGLDMLGKIHWYREGAAWLVGTQYLDGSWSKDPITTAFAVLFLARTFQPAAGITKRNAEEVLLRLSPRAGQGEVERAVAAVVEAGAAEGVPACLKALRSGSAAARRAAAAALERLTGIRTVFDPGGDPTTPENQAAARAWERWWMGRRSRG